MAEQFDILFAIAQIAVAFAGFGAIATAFGGRDQGGALRIDAGRLLNMLTASLVCIVLAVMPPAIAQFDIAERWIWSAGAAIYVIVAVVALPGVLIRTRQMGQHGVLSVPALIAGLVFIFAGILAMALCLFDIPSGKGGATYIAGLTCMLCNTVTLFYVLVQSILKPYAPDVRRGPSPGDLPKD